MLNIHAIEKSVNPYIEEVGQGEICSFLLDLEDGECNWKGIMIDCKFDNGKFIKHLNSKRHSTIAELSTFGIYAPISVSLTKEDIQMIQSYYDSNYASGNNV